MQRMREKRLDTFIKLIRRVRLQTRLLAVFLAVSLLPVLSIGIYAYQIYTGSVNDKVGEYAEQSTKLLNKTLQQELEKYSAYISALSITRAVQDMSIRAEGAAAAFSLAEQREIETTIAQTNAVGGRYLRDIQIVDRNGNILFGPGYEISAGVQYKGLLKDIDKVTPKDSLQYTKGYYNMGNIVLGRKIYRYGTGSEPAGYILVYINAKLLHDQIFGGVDFGPDSKVLLMAQEGTVLSSSEGTLQGTSLANEALYTHLLQSAARGEPTFPVKMNGSNYLTVFSHSPLYDSYFIVMVPNSYIANETHSITVNLVVLAIVLFIASFFIMLLIYYSITNPVKSIVAMCNAIFDEDLERRIGDTGTDEIGFLAQTIDHLVDKLMEMMARRQSDQKRKRELELESLHYQINPHFLFNTLNTLKWVASLNEVPTLYEGLDSLSSLLQSTLSKTDERISIEEELKNLAHYISIQRIRYADCFDVSYQIQESTLPCSIPRFALQPLVENAIIHGTDDRGRRINIQIACHTLENGDIRITVTDDGKGFEMSHQPTPLRERFSGIGIANVDERLKLYYGTEYGLKVNSRPEEGTECVIVIPSAQAGHEEEVKSDVSYPSGG